jgi:hypothetical protein
MPVGDGNRADVCVDLTQDLCEADADCAEDSYCRFLLADQEKVLAGCFTPLDSTGRPTVGLRPGEACDPRTNVHDHDGIACTADGDCPAGWSCRLLPYTDGYNQCFPPASESCLFSRGRVNWDSSAFHCRDRRFCGCLDEGVCGGFCRTDDDCGPSMRCSQATIVALQRGSYFTYDDTFHTGRFCTYAAGSRTPCVREADCATTGAAGARETCQVTTDIDGAPSGICVTPPPGVGLVGDICGDDPATQDVDYRPCVNDCINGACAGACEVDADCPAGFDCQQHFLDQVAATGMCTPAASCARDADCAGGQVCQLVTTAEGGVTRCGPPLGELGAAGFCDLVGDLVGFDEVERLPQTTCASLYCDSAQYCSALCRRDVDCPAGMRCVEMTWTVNGRGTLDRSDDLTVTFNACENGYGSRAPCTTDGDCPEWFEGCLTTFVGGTQVNECVETFGVVQVGELCAGSCRIPFPCVIDYFRYTSYCTGACASDADCGSTGLVCRRYQDDRVNVEWTLCLQPDDPRDSPL